MIKPLTEPVNGFYTALYEKTAYYVCYVNAKTNVPVKKTIDLYNFATSFDKNTKLAIVKDHFGKKYYINTSFRCALDEDYETLSDWQWNDEMVDYVAIVKPRNETMIMINKMGKVLKRFDK